MLKLSKILFFSFFSWNQTRRVPWLESPWLQCCFWCIVNCWVIKTNLEDLKVVELTRINIIHFLWVEGFFLFLANPTKWVLESTLLLIFICQLDDQRWKYFAGSQFKNANQIFDSVLVDVKWWGYNIILAWIFNWSNFQFPMLECWLGIQFLLSISKKYWQTNQHLARYFYTHSLLSWELFRENSLQLQWNFVRIHCFHVIFMKKW